MAQDGAVALSSYGQGNPPPPPLCQPCSCLSCCLFSPFHSVQGILSTRILPARLVSLHFLPSMVPRPPDYFPLVVEPEREGPFGMALARDLATVPSPIHSLCRGGGCIPPGWQVGPLLSTRCWPQITYTCLPCLAAAKAPGGWAGKVLLLAALPPAPMLYQPAQRRLSPWLVEGSSMEVCAGPWSPSPWICHCLIQPGPSAVLFLAAWLSPHLSVPFHHP